MNDVFNKKNVLLITLILIVSIPNIIQSYLGNTDFVISPVKKVYFVLFSISIQLFILSLLNTKKFIYLTWFLTPLALIDFVSIIKTKSAVNINILLSFLETNKNESIEFLSNNFFLIILGTLYVSSIMFISKKLIKKASKLESSFRKAIFIISSLFLLVAFARVYIKYYNLFTKDKEYIESKEGYFSYATNGVIGRITSISPWSTINSIINLNDFVTKREVLRIKSKKQKYNIIYSSNSGKNTVILIIGESARRNNFGIYGYKRNTTPLIENIPDLISFNDATASSNLTNISVPIIITSGTPNNMDSSYSEKGLIGAFSEANYETTWITSQKYIGEATLSYLSSLANNKIDLSSGIGQGTANDLAILDSIPNVIFSNSKSNFIIIHSVGSHFAYNYRYPERFDIFKPSKTESIFIDSNIDNKKKLINAYDNSILFTDFFIKSVIDLFNKPNESVAIIYISDHGENLYDDERNLSLHGTTSPSKYEIEIPMFMWFSNEYKKNNIDKISNIIKNKDKKVSSTNIFHTILNIANLTFRGIDENKIISGEQFKEEKRLIFTPNQKIYSID